MPASRREICQKKSLIDANTRKIGVKNKKYNQYLSNLARCLLDI